MGAPALQGTFLGGDDIQLVRDHVLVNRPSLTHLGQLFAIAHRDLYQPVALASFQLDFLIVSALGGEPARAGDVPHAWVFHLTNVLLHGACALLVWALARRVTGNLILATAAGLFFALHPLNVETVAWLNGRMMLLSTAFLLGGLLLLELFRTRGGWWRALLAVLCVALCHMSKVRPALPLLFVIPLLLSAWRMPPRRWWTAWGAVAVITAGFVVLNIRISGGLFAEGAEHLQGSRIARSVLAVGWHLTHLVAPVGLARYHPTPELVTWSSPGVVPAALAILVAGIAVIISAKRTRLGWTGALWFLLALAATLPLTSARNLAFAERYMYVPLAGACWPLAAGLLAAGRRIGPQARSAGACALALALCAGSWHAMSFYRTDVLMTGRIAALYPQYPALQLAYADALLREGQLKLAADITRPFTDAADADVACDAWELLGQAAQRRGKPDEALANFQRALERKPDSAAVRARLGSVLLAAGRTEEAAAELARAAELAPAYNPALLDLAQANRVLGRVDDARRAYLQVLENNPYDPSALAGLAELAIAAGDFDGALARLASAGRLVPGNTQIRALDAWTRFLAGDLRGAAAQVERTLAQSPDEPLAQMVALGLMLAQGDATRAITAAETLATTGRLADPALFDAYARVVETCAAHDPQNPWPYYLMVVACDATGRSEAAHVAADAFKSLNSDPQWHARVDALLADD